jgi:hypothetical protein
VKDKKKTIITSLQRGTLGYPLSRCKKKSLLFVAM